MALNLNTTNYDFRDKWMSCLVRRALLTGPASYATGGVAIDNAGDFGWGETHSILGTLWNGSAARELWLDRVNQKIVIIVPNTGAEVANTTDLSAFTGQIVATGK